MHVLFSSVVCTCYTQRNIDKTMPVLGAQQRFGRSTNSLSRYNGKGTSYFNFGAKHKPLFMSEVWRKIPPSNNKQGNYGHWTVSFVTRCTVHYACTGCVHVLCTGYTWCIMRVMRAHNARAHCTCILI